MDDDEVESRVRDAFESAVSPKCSRILEKLLLDLQDGRVESSEIK